MTTASHVKPTLVPQKGQIGSIGECISVACSFDGRFIASGGTGGILIWDIATGWCLRKLRVDRSDVTSVCTNKMKMLLHGLLIQF